MKNAANLKCAVTASFPVLLGYMAIGVAFGLMLTQAGYPWYLALLMSAVMYAGAGQYLAVGLFVSGAGLAEAVLLQFVVNARHIAYGLTMLGRFAGAGRLKPYLVFALSDETFALLSAVPEDRPDKERFMFTVALLDQCYWTAGSVAGAIAGSLLPFGLEGVGFALTALFVVLMIEQAERVRRAAPFVVSAAVAVAAAVALPSRVALLSALAASLAIAFFAGGADAEPS